MAWEQIEKFFKNIDNSEKVIIDVKEYLIKIKSRN